MRRGTLLVGAAALLAIAVVAVVLLAGALDSQQDARPVAQQGLPSTSERAPEAESRDVGALPGVHRAARGFLAGYLPLIYGQAGAEPGDLRHASAELVAQLTADPGRVPPAQAARTPILERLAVVDAGAARALATAQINDAPASTYPLSFQLVDTPRGWVVTELGTG